ncbi:MAG: methyltransferase domain-containing protein [Planctomycetes bacterium]|nr:methyltransferase domain-containing protein [Planctomycetota bacterium]
MIKKSIKTLLSIPAIARLLVHCALRMHNFSYAVLRNFTPHLEPDKLHPKHRLMKYHQWFINNLQEDWVVLDVGCGNGALAYDLKTACQKVVGIEQNPESVAEAKERFKREGIEYICADATRFNFSQRLDAIVLSNVLEHIDDRVQFLQALYNNQCPVNPPVLLLRVPMLDRDWLPLYKREFAMEWRLDPTHRTEYLLDELREELKQAGLRIERYDIRFGEFYGVVKKR